MQNKIQLSRIPEGQVKALEARMKPLAYQGKDADEISLQILKGMRFSGSIPAEAARKLLKIELNVVKAEASMGHNAFRSIPPAVEKLDFRSPQERQQFKAIEGQPGSAWKLEGRKKGLQGSRFF